MVHLNDEATFEYLYLNIYIWISKLYNVQIP